MHKYYWTQRNRDSNRAGIFI